MPSMEPRSGGRCPIPLVCAALAVGALTLGGCAQTSGTGSASATTSASTAPLAATAVAPVALHLNVGSYSLESSTATISGTVSAGATVTVNHHRASVHGGHWSKTLQLRLGENRVAVEATLKGRRSARKTIILTREKSSAEVEAETRTREGERNEETTTSSTGGPSPAECTNDTYVNSAGNTVCRPEESPSAPTGATAECADGTYSFSESRSGTCSHHGGVARWLR
jgi:hypothetical protein